MAEYIKPEKDRYIKLSQALEVLDSCACWWAHDRMELIHAADVQPVVRCRDCEHKGWVQEPEHGKSVDYCRLLERCVDKQFFCAAGERKTNCGADMREES